MAGGNARTPIFQDARLSDLEFVAFDTETTGCASSTGRIVEFGAVRFRSDGVELDRFTQLVNPLRPIPAAVTRIHGITNEMVRDCPPESAVLPQFLSFLGDPGRSVLMAHNARFDMAFLGSALTRCRMPAPPHAVIDTVRLSRRRAGGLASHSLSALVRSFGIAPTTEHRGLSDSLALKQVFLHLVARPPALETAADLFALAPPWRVRREREENRDKTPSPAGPGGGWIPRDSLGARVLAELRGHDESQGAERAVVDLRSRLTQAISAGRCVSLIYEGGRSAGERRSVTPLRFLASFEVTYLVAFCHDDLKQKQYRLDRVREVSVE